MRTGQATGDDQTGEDISAFERLANTVVNAGNMGSGFFNLQPDFNAVSVPEDASMVRWETWIYTDVNGGIEITFTDEAMTGSFDYAPAPLDPNIPIRTLALTQPVQSPQGYRVRRSGNAGLLRDARKHPPPAILLRPRGLSESQR